MKIGVIAMQGTKTFQTHLRKLSHCHCHHQHSLNFKRHSSRRNGAAPGPNGIPNTVWKRCSCLHAPLFNIIQRVWKSCSVPSSWQCVAIRLFHKSGPTDNSANFRPIVLSNCEGKIFFALLGKAMLKNSFFDQRLQKGFLPGVAGCLEHSALLADAIQEARSRQRAICIS